MAAVEPTGEDGRSWLVSTAFAALSVLFDECVRDIWTPLRDEQRNRLAQQFDDSLTELSQKLDSNSFGAYECISFLQVVFRCRTARSPFLLSFLSADSTCFSSPSLTNLSTKIGSLLKMCHHFSKYHGDIGSISLVVICGYSLRDFEVPLGAVNILNPVCPSMKGVE